MQFDFLKHLFGKITAPAKESSIPSDAPDESEESDSSPEPESQEAEPQEPTRIPLPSISTLLELSQELLRNAGAPALAERLSLRWNPRLRNTAGMAYPGKSLVVLNPRLAIFGDEEIDRTLRHELGHLLAQERVGRRRIEPHGKEWKKACADLGLPDESRTHNLPLPRKKVRPRFFYQCPSCKFVLPRVKPLRRKSACMQCCRAHNKGRFDARFLFKAVVPVPEPGSH